MSGFLSTIRLSQDKTHLCSSEANGRAEPVSCKAERMAQLKLCGSSLMIYLTVLKSSQCIWKKEAVCQFLYYFFFKKCFQVFFIFFSFSDTELAGKKL